MRLFTPRFLTSLVALSKLDLNTRVANAVDTAKNIEDLKHYIVTATRANGLCI